MKLMFACEARRLIFSMRQSNQPPVCGANFALASVLVPVHRCVGALEKCCDSGVHLIYASAAWISGNSIDFCELAEWVAFWWSPIC